MVPFQKEREMPFSLYEVKKGCQKRSVCCVLFYFFLSFQELLFHQGLKRGRKQYRPAPDLSSESLTFPSGQFSAEEK